MKLFLIGMLTSISVFALPYTYYVDFTSPPQAAAIAKYPSKPQIDLTYGGTYPSGPMAVIQLINGSPTAIEANCVSTEYPSNSMYGASFVVPANSTNQTPVSPLYTFPLGSRCWFRSYPSGTISTGTFEAIAWGR